MQGSIARRDYGPDVQYDLSERAISLLFFGQDTGIDLLPMHTHRFRRIHPDSYLVSIDTENGYRNFVSDHQALTHSSCQNQHLQDPRTQPKDDYFSKRQAVQNIGKIPIFGGSRPGTASDRDRRGDSQGNTGNRNQLICVNAVLSTIGG